MRTYDISSQFYAMEIKELITHNYLEWHTYWRWCLGDQHADPTEY